MKKITPETVRQSAKALFKADKFSWVVVGDLTKIEQNIRNLNIAPVEVWDATGKKLR